VFVSELKALKAYHCFDAPVCRQALVQYLRFMYVQAPRSIYQGIYKLELGCLPISQVHHLSRRSPSRWCESWCRRRRGS
jgi:asparagine synthase (glutamine-hydrolysing)